MPLHLIKLAVGVTDIDHIRAIQATRAQTFGQGGAVPVHTGFAPKRADEVLDGGSLYWVIRGSVAVRQRVLAIDSAVDADGRRRCVLTVDADLVAVAPTPHRPFQGWRYLEPAKAPPDLGANRGDATAGGDELPPHLVAELRALGLL